MKEILEALKNSNNESGKHIKYLYEKYCRLLYEVDYGNKIYESEELFTDFMKYIFDSNIKITKFADKICFELETFYWYESKIYINKKSSSNSIMTSIRELLTSLKLEQNKNSNLNQLKNAKLP